MQYNLQWNYSAWKSKEVILLPSPCWVLKLWRTPSQAGCSSIKSNTQQSVTWPLPIPLQSNPATSEQLFKVCYILPKVHPSCTVAYIPVCVYMYIPLLDLKSLINSGALFKNLFSFLTSTTVLLYTHCVKKKYLKWGKPCITTSKCVSMKLWKLQLPK